MIYYQLNDGTLVGNQADAKKSKQEFVQIDIPVDKQGLMDWLNSEVVPLFQQVQQAPAASATVEQTAELPTGFKAELTNLEQVREFVLSSDPAIFFGVIDAVIERFQALKAEID